MRTEEIPDHEISQVNLQLLRWCLSEIPAGGTPHSYTFETSELEERFQRFDDVIQDGPPNRAWRAYFANDGADSWKIDVDEVVKAWCGSLQTLHGVTIDSIDLNVGDLSSASVVVSTNNRGNILFDLFFDSESLLKEAPNPAESKFLIWFVEPASGDDRDSVYSWHEVNSERFWDKIIKEIIENQRAPDEAICQINSHAVSQNFDGVKDNIKVFAESEESSVNTQPQLIDNVQRADSQINIDAVDFALDIKDKEHLLICECDEVGSETLHAHLIVDGGPEIPNDNEIASRIIEKSHKKVRRYNDLFDDQQRASKFIKLAIGLFAVGALPAATNVVEYITGSSSGELAKIYAGIGIVALTISIPFFVYTILPLVRLRWFSWDTPKTTDVIDKLHFW